MRKKLFAGLFFLFTVMLTACEDERQADDGKYYEIYYVNADETKILNREYVTETQDNKDLLEEMLVQLSTQPEKREYTAPLANGFEVVSYTLDNGLLTMNFDEHYRNVKGTKEVLVRAAIVRTLVQLPEVERVSFTVQGEQLVDSNGVAIGTMSSDTFIENAGNEINAYEKANLNLYFANESGDMLVEEHQRNVVYNSNISLEKLVVEKLLEGPQTEGVYPTINPATKIVSVMVKDGICYVNLSEDFLSQPYNVTSDVTLYSITNSLVELPNVNRVQIAVNGETDISYRENISLNTVFERNLDLLATETEE